MFHSPQTKRVARHRWRQVTSAQNVLYCKIKFQSLVTRPVSDIWHVCNLVLKLSLPIEQTFAVLIWWLRQLVFSIWDCLNAWYLLVRSFWQRQRRCGGIINSQIIVKLIFSKLSFSCWTRLAGLAGGSVRGADRGRCAEVRGTTQNAGVLAVLGPARRVPRAALQLSSQLFASHIVHDRPHGT